VFYGVFVWARRALKHYKRRFPARAVAEAAAAECGAPIFDAQAGYHRLDARLRRAFRARGFERRLHRVLLGGWVRSMALAGAGGGGAGARGQLYCASICGRLAVLDCGSGELVEVLADEGKEAGGGEPPEQFLAAAALPAAPGSAGQVVVGGDRGLRYVAVGSAEEPDGRQTEAPAPTEPLQAAEVSLAAADFLWVIRSHCRLDARQLSDAEAAMVFDFVDAVRHYHCSRHYHCNPHRS
jgi:hypothetical protein